jgi:hypothetical protein
LVVPIANSSTGAIALRDADIDGILLVSPPFHSFYLFYFILFYFILFYFILFYFILFYFMFLCVLD